MFKSVEYAGFEAHPDLRALAERGTAALGAVIHDWRDALTVTWRPTASDTLELELALDVTGAPLAATGCVRRAGFAPGEESLLRIDAREVWLDVLDRLTAELAARRERAVAELVEA
jgi:hypothetical protein